ncbi:MAG: phospholipase [Nitriliruptorales bacterium]|nr:phospholipase [Nitriliruptorales bacterium]
MPPITPDRADLVLEGGGVKGIAHVGAIHALQDRGVDVYPRVAGTSAGSIVGALAAAGVPATKMLEIMYELDYRKVRDRAGVDRMPVVGKGLSLMLEDGIYEGEYIRDFLGNVLHDAGVETFADLRIEGPAREKLPPGQAYKLVVMATDLTSGCLVRLPWDYQALYGLDPDRELVVDAVRASMAIPFYFEPVRLRHADGKVSILVDGGVLSNFAIDVFDRRDGAIPRWPTFGVKLLPKLPEGRAQLFPLLGLVPRGPVHLLELLISTVLVGRDQTQLNQPWVDARTVRIDTSAAGVVDFGLNKETMDQLYAGGRAAAETFLDTWDFDDYRSRFRS